MDPAPTCTRADVARAPQRARSLAYAGLGITAVLVALLAVTCSAVLAAAAPKQQAAAAPTTDPAAMSNTQLVASANRLQGEALVIGNQLLGVDARVADAGVERARAEEQLAHWLAEAYKDGHTAGSFTAVVGGGDGSLVAIVRRLEVARTVNDYQGELVASLERTEQQVDLAPEEKRALVARMAEVNRAAGVYEDELHERERIAREKFEAARAKHDAKVRREQEAAAAALAAQQAALGSLASYSGGAGGGVAPYTGAPLVTGPLSAGQLDQYLASKGSPMAGQGAAFMDSGIRWGVDPRLLVAIAGAESDFGNITCGPHNAWGWACPNSPAEFPTWAAGIERVTRGLRTGYLDEGRTRVTLIQQKYCPVGAANDPTGLNNHWTTNVTKFLVELGGNPDDVGPGPGAQPPGAAAAA